LPRFNFFDMSAPIFSRPRFLPGSKINGAQVDHAVISDGCIINRAIITHSMVGLRCLGTRHGAESCHSPRQRLLRSAESIAQHEQAGLPRVGIGSNSRLENTIVDKNADRR
jgi:glucose-1-phosphate adenylyltransferase